MAFGEPFGCLRDGVFHAWVSLITQTIKAGALEQATRRMFLAGTWPQKLLMNVIPGALRRKRRHHLELSKEKCLKCVYLPIFTSVTSFCAHADNRRNRRIDQGLTREHRDFLYYILRQNEKGGVSQDEIILNSALFM